MAKRFIFTMQPVLDQRLRIEEQRQRVVAAFEQERLAIEERIRGYQQSIQSARQDLRDCLSAERVAASDAHSPSGDRTCISLSSVRMQASASLHLLSLAQHAVLQLAGVHQRLDAARLELLKATADRKAVEMLRDKRLAEWRAAQRQQEYAELDELTVMRHGRHDQDITEEAA